MEKDKFNDQLSNDDTNMSILRSWALLYNENCNDIQIYDIVNTFLVISANRFKWHLIVMRPEILQRKYFHDTCMNLQVLDVSMYYLFEYFLP